MFMPGVVLPSVEQSTTDDVHSDSCLLLVFWHGRRWPNNRVQHNENMRVFDFQLMPWAFSCSQINSTWIAHN
jgi:hypothetical protein